MKSTEIFVEQVLIGGMVLVMFSPLVGDDVLALLAPIGGVQAVAAGAALLGAAYLVGIVYDRWADTVLEDIEQHGRWTRVQWWQRNPRKADDPFPEGRYRMRLLDRSAAADYAGYLRSRVRLSRALASLLPGLCVAYVLWKTRAASPSVAWWAAGGLLGAIYALMFVAQLARGTLHRRHRRRKGEQAGGDAPGWYRVPKTWEGSAARQAELYERRGVLGLAVHEPAAWGGVALTALGCVVAVRGNTPGLIAVPLVGAVVTYLVGWTWWRISHTYWQFLRDYSEHGS